MIYYSNCKINIGLNIIGRRTDGYHELSTLFYPVNNMRDAIEIVVIEGNKIEFTCSGLGIDSLPHNNLCTRAARLFMERCGTSAVRVHLHKSIPTAAGLGGGSANAAVVLKAMNTIFNTQLSTVQLVDMCGELGSDVACFIENKPMRGAGRGELLTSVDLSLKGYWLTIVKTDLGMSTREAFSLNSRFSNPTTLAEELPLEQWRELVVNDFEDVVFERFPLLAQIKRELYDKGALYASMSGSGTAIFAISRSPIPLSDFRKYGFCHSEECSL